MSASKAGGQQAGVPAQKKTGRGSVMANKLTMRTTEEVSVLANELAMLLWVEGVDGDIQRRLMHPMFGWMQDLGRQACRKR